MSLLAHLPKPCLLLTDRLYSCAAFLDPMVARQGQLGTHFLVRVRDPFSARVVRRLKDENALADVPVRDRKVPNWILRTLRLRHHQPSDEVSAPVGKQATSHQDKPPRRIRSAIKARPAALPVRPRPRRCRAGESRGTKGRSTSRCSDRGCSRRFGPGLSAASREADASRRPPSRRRGHALGWCRR